MFSLSVVAGFGLVRLRKFGNGGRPFVGTLTLIDSTDGVVANIFR